MAKDPRIDKARGIWEVIAEIDDGNSLSLYTPKDCGFERKEKIDEEIFKQMSKHIDILPTRVQGIDSTCNEVAGCSPRGGHAIFERT